MKAYKAFNTDLSCNKFQYEIGKTFEMHVMPELCHTGFHACANPLDIFRYYTDVLNNRYAEVELSNEIITYGDKSCANKISIIRELCLSDIINEAAKYCKSFSEDNNTAIPSYDPYKYSLTTKDGCIAASAAHRSPAITLESNCFSITTGDYSNSISFGNFSRSITQGISTAITDGYSSSSISFKNNAISIGESSCSITKNRLSKSLSIGRNSVSYVEGSESLACNLGYNGHVYSSKKNNLLIAVEYDDSGTPISFAGGFVDGVTILPEKYYKCVNGKLELVKCIN